MKMKVGIEVSTLSVLVLHAQNSLADLEKRRAAGENVGSEEVESWVKSAIAQAEKVLPDRD